jgi:hypothetical protein
MEMKAKGLDKRYIADTSDIQKTVIEKPKIFQDKSEYDQITANELKSILTLKDIEFPTNATKRELYELYISK